MYNLASDQIDSGLGLSILAVAAPVLLPRLAFNLMPDNILYLPRHTDETSRHL